MIHESITLYYREGSSDKVYQAAVEERPGGYVVTFAYGRRGSAFQTGTKTPTPVSLSAATSIYGKLVDAKMAKGYTPGPEGTPYVATPDEERHTGIACQLLNTVDESEVEALLTNPSVCAQEKYDGKRMLLRITGDGATAINRRGLQCGLPQSIEQDALLLRAAWSALILDGECVGDTYYIFDCLRADEDNLQARPYAYRFNVVTSMRPVINLLGFRIARTAMSLPGKRLLLDSLRSTGREGIVFKHLDAPYTPGRPASGGSQLKYKFTQTATVRVLSVSSNKRSVRIGVDRAHHTGVPLWVEVGSVTIPPNAAIPPVGTLVDVRYLYAYPEGSLYQPVYVGPRDDVGIDACTLAQLKIKTTPSEEDT